MVWCGGGGGGQSQPKIKMSLSRRRSINQAKESLTDLNTHVYDLRENTTVPGETPKTCKHLTQMQG